MRTFSTEAIILKRSNIGEADRIVTLFTKDFGKIACIAKGVRKMTSTKRSSLEPGMYSKIFCAKGHGMPILTQAQILDDFQHTRSSLVTTRNLSQVLEILDTVTVEEEGQDGAFEQVLDILRALNEDSASSKSRVTQLLRTFLAYLGFQDVNETKFSTISAYVEFLADKKLKSFSYLTVH
ncbi:MAG TPA: DNA repair protein RecO [Patescibacteria group bacterium]|nr:DNA repair protein RecO [Patescibacteria group bacterium]